MFLAIPSTYTKLSLRIHIGWAPPPGVYFTQLFVHSTVFVLTSRTCQMETSAAKRGGGGGVGVKVTQGVRVGDIVSPPSYRSNGRAALAG